MKTTSDSSHPEPFAYDSEVTQYIPLGELEAILGTEDETLFVGGQVPIEDLAKLNAHWYESMFVALSFDKKRKIVKLHVVARQAQQLVNPKTGVGRGKAKGFKPRFVTPDGLPVYYPKDLFRAVDG
jgi:hypothetical protein